jgi:TolA-binding protein
MKFVILMMAMAMTVGCAAKATGPTLEDKFNAHVSAVEADHTTMTQKDAEQDARLTEVESRLDRAFVKGK